MNLHPTRHLEYAMSTLGKLSSKSSYSSECENRGGPQRHHKFFCSCVVLSLFSIIIFYQKVNFPSQRPPVQLRENLSLAAVENIFSVTEISAPDPVGFINWIGGNIHFTIERVKEEYESTFKAANSNNQTKELTDQFPTFIEGQWKRLRTATANPTIGWRRGVSGPASAFTIYLAAVACGDRGKSQVLVMLKSALVFSQDCHLHAHVFFDPTILIPLALGLLELKWTADTLGWGFTFTLHPEWFPAGPWRELWAPCSTQRLFFPTLLGDTDSVIFLDADVIVVSSLREMWMNFERHMTGEEVVGMTANTLSPATGHYTRDSKVPYYGYGGVNGGVILMNLTRMREFGMQERFVAAYTAFSDKIVLGDQDILNIIFHTYPERLFLLECVYQFNWSYCGGGETKMVCVYHGNPGDFCFCKAAMSEGVRIVHGNLGTFNPSWPFLYQLQQSFEKMDLMLHDPVQVVQGLMYLFDRLEDRPVCFNLTSDALYRNALTYLAGLPRMSF